MGVDRSRDARHDARPRRRERRRREDCGEARVRCSLAVRDRLQGTGFECVGAARSSASFLVVCNVRANRSAAVNVTGPHPLADVVVARLDPTRSFVALDISPTRGGADAALVGFSRGFTASKFAPSRVGRPARAPDVRSLHVGKSSTELLRRASPTRSALSFRFTIGATEPVGVDRGSRDALITGHFGFRSSLSSGRDSVHRTEQRPEYGLRGGVDRRKATPKGDRPKRLALAVRIRSPRLPRDTRYPKGIFMTVRTLKRTGASKPWCWILGALPFLLSGRGGEISGDDPTIGGCKDPGSPHSPSSRRFSTETPSTISFGGAVRHRSPTR